MQALYGWQEKRLKEYLTKAGTEVGQFRFILIFDRPYTTRVINDFELNKFPGLYILLKFGEEMPLGYIGETDELGRRLEDHGRNPPEELGEWDKAILLNDGRIFQHSLLADLTLRAYLEKATINLIRQSPFCKVVNRVAKKPPLPMGLDFIGRRLEHELSFILEKLQLATYIGDEAIEIPDEIPVGEVEAILATRKGYLCRLGEHDGTIVTEEGEFPVYVRPGSLKPRGWQVTIRERGNRFRESVEKGEGFLLVNRGRCFLIPLEKIKEWLSEQLEATSSTIDIFADISKKQITCPKANQPLNISEYQLL